MFIVQVYTAGAYRTIDNLNGDKPTPRLFTTREQALAWATGRFEAKWRVVPA